MMAVVLVVDARRASRDQIADLLGRAGHGVLEAESAHDAREVIRSERPDLVIVGVLTPRMSGFDFFRRLRADPVIHQPAVVFCTATYLAAQVRELCNACGISVVPAREGGTPSAVTAFFEGDDDVPGAPVGQVDRTLRVLCQRLLEREEELGEAHRSRSRLLAELVRAEEAERNRIASAVHDDSIQVMSAAVLRLETLAQDLARSEQGDAVGEVAEKVRQAVVRLRGLIFHLSPPDLTGGGLGAAIEAYLVEVGPEAGFLWAIENRLRTEIAHETQAMLFWIVREAIRNARKHAEASTVTVTLSESDGGSLVRIADDGVGFVLGRLRPGHFGLPSMRERAAAVGGSLQIETAPSAGCVVEAWAPHSVPRAATRSPDRAYRAPRRAPELAP